MKKFVTKTLLISLPIIFFILVLEVLLRKIPNDYEFKREYLDKHAHEIETLILGSSHSLYGLDPEYFKSNTFNASHISQSLDYDFEILRKYESKFKSLKTVVLPVSYFSLFSKLEDGTEAWRIKNYTIYYGLKSSKALADHSEFLSNQLNVNLRRLYSHYFAGRSNITCSRLGWGISYNSKNARDLIETGNSAAKRHTRENIDSGIYKEIFEENVLIVNSIIKWCKKNDVRVLILTPPAFETYRRNLNHDQLAITIKAVMDISIRYDNCKYYNLLDDSSFKATDYYDADHLSEIGAAKLSRLINDKVQEWK